MNFREWYDKQCKLDNYIMENMGLTNIVSHEDLLQERILALMVEVSEFANATRCFKYWSIKGSESRERLLDEMADMMHFIPSIWESCGFEPEEVEGAYDKKYKVNIERQLNNY